MTKVKEFSIQTGFSIRMLRYLEEVEVLIPTRDANNYRIYSAEQAKEALWIKKLQGIGLQLKEIESMKKRNHDHQFSILKNTLKREEEIAAMKSETIPELQAILSFMNNEKKCLQDYYEADNSVKSRRRVVGKEEKFKRTAYTIPILRNIYEDHITRNAQVDLIATDLLKFGEWFKSCSYAPEVYSVLNDSSFVFGLNFTNEFLEGYEKSWSLFLPKMGFTPLFDFLKEDVEQLMGPHDIVIRTTFKYREDGRAGEIVIPYAPVYTMAQIRKKEEA